MDNAELARRREARRRKILNADSSRLAKITGEENIKPPVETEPHDHESPAPSITAFKTESASSVNSGPEVARLQQPSVRPNITTQQKAQPKSDTRASSVVACAILATTVLSVFLHVNGVRVPLALGSFIYFGELPDMLPVVPVCASLSALGHGRVARTYLSLITHRLSLDCLFSWSSSISRRRLCINPASRPPR